MSKILIIDDEEIIVEAVTTILSDMGHSVTGCSSSVEGVKKALEADFDLIISDLRMPDMNGAEVTEKIIAEKPDSKILIITAFPLDPIARQALDFGAMTLLKKPFEISKILLYLE